MLVCQDILCSDIVKGSQVLSLAAVNALLVEVPVLISPHILPSAQSPL